MKHEILNNIQIFKIEPELTYNNIADFHKDVLGCININLNTKVLLDFTNCKTVDSSGLDVLFLLRKELNNKKCPLYFTGVSVSILEIMQITGITKVISIVSSIDQI